MYATVVLAVAFTGPWTYSLDHVLGLQWTGVGWALGALGLGVVSATLMLLTRRPKPAEEQKGMREAA